MANVPKFNACGQDWSKMTPVNGGRMCGECNKKVVDMSRMRWKQIEQLHNDQPGICGLYSPKQVQHWGHEIPNNSVCSKALAITSMMLTLAGVPFVSHSQSVNEVEVKFDCEPVDSTKALPTDVNPKTERTNAVNQTSDSSKCTIVKGFVFDSDRVPVPFGVVVFTVDGRQIGGGYTDENGFYEVDLTQVVDQKMELTLKSSYIGYAPVEIQLHNACFQKTTEVNVTLEKMVYVMGGVVMVQQTPLQKAGQKVFNVLRRFKY